MADPLARALKALQYLHAPRTDPVSVAFNRFPGDLGREGQPWSEEAFLVALDHLSDDEGQDDQDEDEDIEEPRH